MSLAEIHQSKAKRISHWETTRVSTEKKTIQVPKNAEDLHQVINRTILKWHLVPGILRVKSLYEVVVVTEV